MLELESANILKFPKSALQPTAGAQQPAFYPSGPIELDMRKKLATLRGTKYPDSFDWGVYDRIADRFGSVPPRGGAVFKTTFKLANHHGSCTKCHYAFELDTYGRGCVHNCQYCYAKEQLTSHGYWNKPFPFPVDLAEVRKVFYTVFETDRPSKWRAIMERPVPLRIGSMSDSFMWIDKKHGITRELLKILKFYNYPHVIFTRSDLIAQDEYLSLMDPKLSAVQFSISGNNEQLTKLIEPGAPSPIRRFEALRTLSKAGFWSTIRINPFIPMRPDGYFTSRREVAERFGGEANIPVFPLFDWDFLDQAKEAGVPSLLAGIVRLSPTSIKEIAASTGVNLGAFFKPENVKGTSDRLYSDQEVGFYYMKFKDECRKRGIRFNTCYIGNGLKDYYQYQELWDNKRDCCDIVENVKAFAVTSQSIPWSERLIHSTNPELAEATMRADVSAELRNTFRS